MTQNPGSKEEAEIQISPRGGGDKNIPILVVDFICEWPIILKMAHFMAPATYLDHIETPLAQVGGRFVGQLEESRV